MKIQWLVRVLSMTRYPIIFLLLFHSSSYGGASAPPIQMADPKMAVTAVTLLRWEEQAKTGVVEAQYNLGVAFEQGLHVSRDIPKAIYWYLCAADQQYPLALFNLGMLYLEKLPESVSTQTLGYYHVEQAAVLGTVKAQYNSGVLSYFGVGTVRDQIAAVYRFKKAARKNDVFAQVNLGVMYLNGLGVFKDVDQANRWLKKASQQSQHFSDIYVAEHTKALKAWKLSLPLYHAIGFVVVP